QDRLAVAVRLDLGHHRRRPEGGTRSLDRTGRQGRGSVAGQPALLEEVDELLLADAEFAREFVCLHIGLLIMPVRAKSKPEAPIHPRALAAAQRPARDRRTAASWPAR